MPFLFDRLQNFCVSVDMFEAPACFSNVLGSLSASSSDFFTSHFMRLRRKWPRDIVAAYHWKDGRFSVFKGFLCDIPSKEQTLEPIKSFPLDKLIQTECPKLQGWNTWNLRNESSIAEQWELNRILWDCLSDQSSEREHDRFSFAGADSSL